MPQNESENQDKPNPPFPNNLRRIREEQAMISRAQLMTQCEQLAVQDATKFVPVGKTTLHDLEAGSRRPRPNTAATLATALNSDTSEIFPSGFDTIARNPKGNIDHIRSEHRTGRPRHNPPSPSKDT